MHLAGPVLFDGYADPEATAQVLHDGWFATADLGEIDADGRLHITGRSDDVVISGGVNVPLPAVTAALRTYEGVRDAVAIGVPDEEWGSRVVAYLVPDDAVCLDGLRLDELRDGVEEAGLPRAWAPREVVLLDALPAAARRQGGPRSPEAWALGHGAAMASSIGCSPLTSSHCRLIVAGSSSAAAITAATSARGICPRSTVSASSTARSARRRSGRRAG